MRLRSGVEGKNVANILLSIQGSIKNGDGMQKSQAKRKTRRNSGDLQDNLMPSTNKNAVKTRSTKKLKTESGHKFVKSEENDDSTLDDEIPVTPVFERVRSRGGRVGRGSRAAPAHRKDKEVPEGAPDCLAGLNFVIGGNLNSLEWKEAVDLIKRHGGKVAGYVSKKTNYLLVDEDIGGSKFSKAKELGTSFLTEDGLFDMILKSKQSPSEIQEKGSCFTPAKTMPKIREISTAQKEFEERYIKLMAEVDEATNEHLKNHTAQHSKGVVSNQDKEMSPAMNISANQPEMVLELQNGTGREEGISQGLDQFAQSSESSRGKKRTRGKTVARENSERVAVEFNERGQPIGSNSVAYSTYLGLIGRELVPITMTDWRKVPLDLKEKLWTMVEENFIVPEDAKKLTLRLIGKNWKDYKARLRIFVYDLYDNDEDRIANCPQGVELNDWKMFVESIAAPDYMEKRKRMKKIRKNHKLPHTSSRMGYARLEDKMKRKNMEPSLITRATVWATGHIKKSGEPVNDLAKEKIEKINETCSSTPYEKGDTLSQVLGPDRRGRVNGMGFGVTPTMLSFSERSSAKVHRLEEEVKALKEEVSTVDALRKEMSQMKDLFARFMESQQNQFELDEEGNLILGNILSNMGVQRSAPRIKCKLTRLIPEDVVANGYWCSDDPTAVVNDEPIGPGMSKIFVIEAVQGDALLIKKTDELRTIGDAVSRVVVWPTSSVIKEGEVI